MNCDPEPDYEAMSGLLVAVIDEKHPELLAEAWDWSKLDGEEWSFLLQDQPKFADKCGVSIAKYYRNLIKALIIPK